MEEKEILMYTMPSCSYCKKMKDELDKVQVKYVVRNHKDYKEEWDKIKALTRSAVFPTFVIGTEIIVPGRDFNSPEEGINYLRYMHSVPQYPQSIEDVIELLKNAIHMIKMLGDKVTQLESKFDALQKNTDMEKIRHQLMEKHKMQAAESQKSREKRKSVIEIAQNNQVENRIKTEAYVQTHTTK